MTALELVRNNLKLTEILSIHAIGIHRETSVKCLDCNCVDGDCSVETYCEG